MSNFVTSNIMGGFGNQLFQIFTTIAYATRYDKPFLFPYVVQLDAKRHSYWSTFLLDLRKNTTFNPIWNVSNVFLDNTVPSYPERTFHYVETPKIDSSFKFSGYFQSYKYFWKEQDIIFRMIHLREQQQNVREMYFSDYFAEPKAILISLHFRLGDYVALPGYHPVMPLEYYRKAIDYILSFLSSGFKIKILYFCERIDNDTVLQKIRELKTMFKEENITFIKVSDDIPDWQQVLVMSSCHHHIIANSTFSWWGAYFNENVSKLVCYPSVWFGVNMGDKKMHDLCPESWKKIEI